VQDVSKLLPIGATECGGQSLHKLLSDAPTTAEYLPSAHGTQTVSTVAPAVEECVPATQPVHALFPDSDLKVPAIQLTHLPSSADDPALQAQSAFTLLAAGE